MPATLNYASVKGINAYKVEEISVNGINAYSIELC
jgi:hypothetical protein